MSAPPSAEENKAIVRRAYEEAYSRGNLTAAAQYYADDYVRHCTGTGEFFFAALNQTITYNFVVTDGGRQIEVLNTNPGIVLQGYGRRIAEAGRAPAITDTL